MKSEITDEDHTNISNQITSDVKSQYLLIFLQMAYPAIFSALIIGIYGIEEYGKFAPLLAVCSTISIVIDFGSGIFLPLQIGRLTNIQIQNRQFASVILFRSIAGTLVAIVGFLISGYIVRNIDTTLTISLIAITIVASILSHQSREYALQRISRFAEKSAIFRFIFILLIIILSAFKVDAAYLLSIYLTCSLVVSVSTADRKILKILLDDRVVRCLRVTFVRSIYHGLAFTCGSITLQVPHLVAGAMLNPVQAGALHLGATLIRATCSMAAPIGISTYAALNRSRSLASGYIKSVGTKLQQVQVYVASFMSIALLVTAIFIFKYRSSSHDNSFHILAGILIIQFTLPLLTTASQLATFNFLSKKPTTRVHFLINSIGLAALTLACIGGAIILNVYGISFATLIYEFVVAIICIKINSSLR
ncbi:hypothetical protein INR38_17145 [Delftia sp. SD018]|uniref:hypothetical protein n=1 Tax=unclassified Delftia TaxID=2613839 RepID=UPI001A956F70|nr:MULTISPECIES: hypothetical protein [unclassified Delftia]MBO0988861.1 hypothetical protein [Delftia sp. SD083]MBO1035809.1 hypothetical protein [Delftia sp. SD018]